MDRAISFPIIFSRHYGQTKKQREVQNAFARSHASKIGHSKRKATELAQRTRATERESSANTEEREPAARADLQLTQEHTLHPHPRTILAESRTDPFNADNLRMLSPITAQSLEYTYEVLWPRNSPALSGPALRSLIELWRQTAVQSDLTFHTQVSLAAGLCYCLSLQPAAKKSLWQAHLKHQCISMKMIREAVASLTGPPSDELIESIMRIAGVGADVNDTLFTSRYAETPINQGFPHAKLYGRFEISPPHFLILRHLVWQRGGLDSLHPMTSQPLQLFVHPYGAC